MNSSASSARATSAVGSAHHDPRELELRQAAALREAAERERQSRRSRGERLRVRVRARAGSRGTPRRRSAGSAPARVGGEPLRGLGVDPRAGGVVRVDEDRGARVDRDVRAREDPAASRWSGRAETGRAHALERRQMLKQRVRRRRARAPRRRDRRGSLNRKPYDSLDDAVSTIRSGSTVDASRRVLAGHGFARAPQPLRIRPVAQPGGMRERIEQARAGRRSRTSRVADRQVVAEPPRAPREPAPTRSASRSCGTLRENMSGQLPFPERNPCNLPYWIDGGRHDRSPRSRSSCSRSPLAGCLEPPVSESLEVRMLRGGASVVSIGVVLRDPSDYDKAPRVQQRLESEARELDVGNRSVERATARASSPSASGTSWIATGPLRRVVSGTRCSTGRTIFASSSATPASASPTPRGKGWAELTLTPGRPAPARRRRSASGSKSSSTRFSANLAALRRRDEAALRLPRGRTRIARESVSARIVA